jgi:hypothetical protein
MLIVNNSFFCTQRAEAPQSSSELESEAHGSRRALFLHCSPVMQATVLAAENEICDRAWKLSALFCIAEHPNIYDSSMQLLPDYVRGLLRKQFQHMRPRFQNLQCAGQLSGASRQGSQSPL